MLTETDAFVTMKDTLLNDIDSATTEQDYSNLIFLLEKIRPIMKEYKYSYKGVEMAVRLMPKIVDEMEGLMLNKGPHERLKALHTRCYNLTNLYHTDQCDNMYIIDID